VISKKGPIKRHELVEICTDAGILGPGRKRPELSAGRINHYLAAMRCMQLVRPGRFFVLQAPYGQSLATIAHYKSKKLHLDERLEFAGGLFRCGATQILLGLFVDGPPPSSYEDFLNRASPAYLSHKRGATVLSSSFAKTRELKTKIDVMSVRWGSLRLCIDMGVIDDIRVPPSKGVRQERSHAVFPVDLVRSWTLSDIDKLIESYVVKLGDNGALSIPELVYHCCVYGRISHETFHSMLNELNSKEPTRFYFDRVPISAIIGYEKAYPKIGGQYRSVVRLIDRGR
jgi:hypothetical protein